MSLLIDHDQRFLANSLRQSRAAFELVLSEPCPVHVHVRPSQPCYDHPRALCGARIHRCMARDAQHRAHSPGRPRRPFSVGKGGAS